MFENRLISKWNEDDYRELLDLLILKYGSTVNAEEFSSRKPGFWMRHDVELCLQSAEIIALIEYNLGVSASYFICVDSPFFETNSHDIPILVKSLLQLNHEVYFHTPLAFAIEGVTSYLEEQKRRYLNISTDFTTYHAPGTNIDNLISLHSGSKIYDGIKSGAIKYFSDSTGRWRWGHPLDFTPSKDSVIQILTHPFWWTKSTERSICWPKPERVREFLPQLMREFE